MITEDDALHFFHGGYREYIPHLSVDCVIFGFHDRELKILLLKWKHLDAWSLPGGYVRQDAELDAAAAGVLRDRTGLDRIYLEQFRVFGSTDRGEQVLRGVYDALGISLSADPWFLDRIVSVGYYALVDFTRVEPAPDFFTEACTWWDLKSRPPLLFDHDSIVDTALTALRRSLSYRPVGLNLMPDKFTMPELQSLYETLLARPLDRRNFQRRIRELGVVDRLDERRTGSPHRAPHLYRFNRERYEKALRDGPGLGF